MINFFITFPTILLFRDLKYKKITLSHAEKRNACGCLYKLLRLATAMPMYVRLSD